MKFRTHLISLTALLALGLAPATRSSAADSADQAKETREKIDSMREGTAKIRNQVGLTLESLNRMQTESIDLREQLGKYTAELAKMEECGKTARDRVMSMQEKGQAYFKAWEDQINSISNKDIREQAKKRYDKREAIKRRDASRELARHSVR